MADALALVCGLLLTKFSEHRKTLLETMSLKKIIDCQLPLLKAKSNPIQFTQTIEGLMNQLFGSH